MNECVGVDVSFGIAQSKIPVPSEYRVNCLILHSVKRDSLAITNDDRNADVKQKMEKE